MEIRKTDENEKVSYQNLVQSKVTYFFFYLLLLNFNLVFADTRIDTNRLPECRSAWSKLIPKNQHQFQIGSKEPYQNYLERVNRNSCQKDWTVLVYMNAQNNLAPYALWDLYEMEAGFNSKRNKAGSTLKTDIVVQLNSSSSHSSIFDSNSITNSTSHSISHSNRSDINRYHIFQSPNVYQKKTLYDFQNLNNEHIQSPLVQNLPNQQSEAERFENFIKWGVQKYPAKNYWIIVWGHGYGWQNSTDRNILNTNSLNMILFNVSKLLSKKIDILTFDSCYMQTLEVTSELTSSVKYITGSNQIQSYLGLPYRRLFYELNTTRFNGEFQRTQSINENYLVARMIPSLVQQSFQPQLGLQGTSDSDFNKFLSSSSVESEEQSQFLIPAMSELSSSLKYYLQADPLRALDLQMRIQLNSNFQSANQDLSLFLSYLEEQVKSELASFASNNQSSSEEQLNIKIITLNNLLENLYVVKNSLYRVIVNRTKGTQVGLDLNSKLILYSPLGISIWIPRDDSEYKKRIGEFKNSRFYNETHWEEWLQLLYY